jgi:hypothetical protein
MNQISTNYFIFLVLRISNNSHHQGTKKLTANIHKNHKKDNPSIHIEMQSHKIPAPVRASVWNIYIGMTQKTGICFCCNKEQISCENFETGYTYSVAKNDNATFRNLRPICGQCHRYVGNGNIEEHMNVRGYVKNDNWYGVNRKWRIRRY